MTSHTGRYESSKEISLSKAAKILSRFVSADNGASICIYHYLRKASKAFNELNRLHKDLKPSQSRRNNHQSHITTDNATPPIRSSSVGVKSEKESRNVNGKSNQNDVEFNQKLNGSKQKKLEFGNQKNVENAKEQEIEKKISNNGKIENGGLGAPQELEIRSKKRNEKVNMQRNSNSEVENTKGQGQQKEVEKKLSNGVKSGGPMGPRDMEIRSKKKLEAGSEKKLYAEEVNTEKRKNQDVENNRSGKHSKKMKRKHEG